MMKKPTAKQMLKNWNKGAKKRLMRKRREHAEIAMKSGPTDKLKPKKTRG
jgi:hypothetical protein